MCLITDPGPGGGSTVAEHLTYNPNIKGLNQLAPREWQKVFDYRSRAWRASVRQHAAQLHCKTSERLLKVQAQPRDQRDPKLRAGTDLIKLFVA